MKVLNFIAMIIGYAIMIPIFILFLIALKIFIEMKIDDWKNK